MEQITGKMLELQKSIRTLQLNITRLIATYTEKESITVAQFRVLLALASTENQTGPMTLLARLLHITTPAVTHLIDKLEGHEVVKRTPHPSDRRSTLISLTPKGQSILQATQGEIIKLLTGTFTEFSEDSQETITNFYKRLNENFSTHELKIDEKNA
jgi:DNA-binding MarR family transcriptional regulator